MISPTIPIIKGTPVSGPVRARFKAGVLELLEKVDLSEGEEVSVEILEKSRPPIADGICDSAGGWIGLVDGDALIERVNADRARPSDRPVPRL